MNCSLTPRDPELLYLGRDYPQGYDFFRPRLHKAFMGNAGLRDEQKIKEGIARADFVRKGNKSYAPRNKQRAAELTDVSQKSRHCKFVCLFPCEPRARPTPIPISGGSGSGVGVAHCETHRRTSSKMQMRMTTFSNLCRSRDCGSAVSRSGYAADRCNTSLHDAMPLRMQDPVFKFSVRTYIHTLHTYIHICDTTSTSTVSSKWCRVPFDIQPKLPFLFFLNPTRISRLREEKRRKNTPASIQECRWLASQVTCGYAGQPAYINDPNTPAP